MDDNCTNFNNPRLAEQLIRATTNFSVALFKHLCMQQSNVIVCPFGVSTVLSMLLTGAKEETAQQLRQLLCLQEFMSEENAEDEENGNGFPLGAAFHDVFNCISTSQEDEEAAKILWGHRLYLQEGFTVNEDVNAQLEQHFGSKIVISNFGTAITESLDEINDWISNEIGKSNVVGAGMVEIFTLLLGVSVSTFQGDWATPFQGTCQNPFYIGGGRKDIVDMMHCSGEFRFAHDENLGCRAIELPYAGNRFSLLILLPTDEDEFHSFENKLSDETISSLVSQLEPTHLHVAVPRFHVSCTFYLSSDITQMGAKDIFDLDSANLSGLVSDWEQGVLQLSDLVHVAELNVNEKGTETIEEAVAPSPCEDEDVEEKFLVDRPFLFLLRDSISNLIAFIGCVHEP